MRLRTARKIMAAVHTPRQSAYTESQIGRAVRRFNRTASARADRAFWDVLCEEVAMYYVREEKRETAAS